MWFKFDQMTELNSNVILFVWKTVKEICCQCLDGFKNDPFFCFCQWLTDQWTDSAFTVSPIHRFSISWVVIRLEMMQLTCSDWWVLDWNLCGLLFVAAGPAEQHWSWVRTRDNSSWKVTVRTMIHIKAGVFLDFFFPLDPHYQRSKGTGLCWGPGGNRELVLCDSVMWQDVDVGFYLSGLSWSSNYDCGYNCGCHDYWDCDT